MAGSAVISVNPMVKQMNERRKVFSTAISSSEAQLPGCYDAGMP